MGGGTDDASRKMRVWSNADGNRNCLNLWSNDSKRNLDLMLGE